MGCTDNPRHPTFFADLNSSNVNLNNGSALAGKGSKSEWSEGVKDLLLLMVVAMGLRKVCLIAEGSGSVGVT